MTTELKNAAGEAVVTTDEGSPLVAALANVQAQLPKIQKGETGEVAGQNKEGKQYRYTYKYADLADITDELMPLLAANGLAFTASPHLTDKGYVLICELIHESGDSRTADWPLPPQNASPQQLGSAITYGRRYLLCAMTGVAPRGDDDDAKDAQRSYDYQRQEQAAEPPDPRDEAFAQLRSVVRRKGLGENNVPGAFQRKMGVSTADASVEQIEEYISFVESSGTLEDSPSDEPGTEPGRDEL